MSVVMSRLRISVAPAPQSRQGQVAPTTSNWSSYTSSPFRIRRAPLGPFAKDGRVPESETLIESGS